MNHSLFEKQAIPYNDTMKLWGGSIAAGAGVGLLGVLYDAVRSQRRKAKAEEGKEPDSIYVDLPPQKKMAYFTEPLVGAGLAGLTAYGIREFYVKWKQDQLRKELDEAQGDYTKSLYAEEPEKVAIAGQMLADAPRDVFFLPAIAAGLGTYGLLNHTFPKTKEKKPYGTPKRIVVRGFGQVKVDGPGDGPLADLDQKRNKPLEVPLTPEQEDLKEEEPLRKAATFEFSKNDHLLAAELLCLSLANHPTLKEASSPLLELLGGYARDPESAGDLIKTAGVLGAISANKGASDYFDQLPEIQKRAAIHCALKDPLLGPSLATLAWAEYAEVSPAHAKMAAQVHGDHELSILVTKFASVFQTLETATWLERNPHDKQAFFSQPQQMDQFMEDSSNNMGTLDLATYKDSDGGHSRTGPDELHRGGAPDPIDNLMTPPQKGLPRNP